MSYILDALKKSDQERQRHTAPGIGAVHTLTRKQLKKPVLWPYLLIGALSLNAVLLLWWLQPWQSTKRTTLSEEPAGQGATTPEAPAAKDQGTILTAELTRASLQQPGPTAATTPEHLDPVSNPPVPAESTPSALDGTASVTTPTPGIPSQRKTEAPQSVQAQAPVEPNSQKASNTSSVKAGSGAQDKSHSPASASRASQKAGKEGSFSPSVSETGSAGAQPVAVSPRKHRESSPARSVDTEEEKLKTMMASVKPAEVPSEREDGASSDLEPPTKPSALLEGDLEPLTERSGEGTMGEPGLDELPPDIRRDLPGLSISMLVYARNPGDRMVGVNGRVFREGQEVEPDLELLQITPKGAIFSFRGHRFHKSVL